jgi:hypothetical protein
VPLGFVPPVYCIIALIRKLAPVSCVNAISFGAHLLQGVLFCFKVILNFLWLRKERYKDTTASRIVLSS